MSDLLKMYILLHLDSVLESNVCSVVFGNTISRWLDTLEQLAIDIPPYLTYLNCPIGQQ